MQANYYTGSGSKSSEIPDIFDAVETKELVRLFKEPLLPDLFIELPDPSVETNELVRLVKELLLPDLFIVPVLSFDAVETVETKELVRPLLALPFVEDLLSIVSVALLRTHLDSERGVADLSPLPLMTPVKMCS